MNVLGGSLVRVVALTVGFCLLMSNSAKAGLYSDSVLLDNPVGYYRLDETSGPTAANSGTASGIDGTFFNIPGATTNNMSALGEAGAPLPGFDPTNKSVLFDPEDGALSTGSDSPIIEVEWNASGSNPLALDGSTGLTVEAWIRRATPVANVGNENEGIAGRYQVDGAGLGDPGRAYVLYYDNDINALAFAISDSGSFNSVGVLEATDYDVPVDEWLHVVGTYSPAAGPDSAMITLYVNGEEIGSRDTTVASIFNGAADFWIGQQFNNDDNWSFEGNIDEVAIYDKVLSEERIAAHYQAAIPEPGSLVLVGMGFTALLYCRRVKLAA